MVRGDSVYVAGGTTVEFSASDGRVVREFVDGATDTEELVVAGDVLIAAGRGAVDLRTLRPTAWAPEPS